MLTYTVIILVADLTLGIGVGWWLRGSNLARKSAVAQQQHTQHVLQALHRLQELTSDVAGHVGQHVLSIESINHELASLRPTSSDAPDSNVIDAVARIVQVNDELTRQLATAKVRIQEQSVEIDQHMAEARTDLLTGLANRRGFDDELQRSFAQWQHQQAPMSVLLIDIDHLQDFHSTHGKKAADAVLRGVAEVLCDSMRAMDLVARYADDRFAVILPGTGLAEATLAAERVRSDIARSEFTHEDATHHVTVSAGVAEVMPGDDVFSLVERTDLALETSRNAGRNCAHLHDGQRCEPIPVDGEVVVPNDPHVVELNVRRYAQEVAAQCGDANTDALTGLPNRRMFFDVLRKRITESNLSRTPLSLMLIDIDQLQKLNDVHGQLVGDVVLRAITQVVASGTRSHLDLLARYEGGKLAVALVDTEIDDALTIAERVRRAIAACRLRAEGNELRVTVSIGAAGLVRGNDAVALIKSAETALKNSKLGGRNCTHFYDHKRRTAVSASPAPAA
jgi:diguanylate cyclase (GGDEF)-like protein